jgi:hypothetical protein
MKFKDLTEEDRKKIACHHPEWMAHIAPDWMIATRPDWMIAHKLDWMITHKPDWVADNYPEWVKKFDDEIPEHIEKLLEEEK